ncbi:hypothetical protein K4L06_03085 [Lysobacter sp. BMK333-48F3]|uniref:hypothetical protein n=1 Tax=Lysobacter sp. BMK333-48F3 TaxID=2867962 RepID=UPI001C8BEC48|nr:hypothetical protein [Lysobacter sp. BMK333-48F3]MBX9400279.1 hypothetical protein [Lysobacter sp. BMK333-48F3]
MRDDAWLVFSGKVRDSVVMVPVRGGVVQSRDQWLFKLSRDEYVLGRDLGQREWPPTFRSEAETALRDLPCGMVVRGEGLVLAHYSVYLDGNVVVSSRLDVDRAPANGIHVRLPSGAHRVTLRTPYGGSSYRESSNTVEFELEPESSVQIVARRTISGLHLEIHPQT